MVTYALIAVGLGALFAFLGWLGVTGRVMRQPSTDTVRNFYGQMLLGPALAGGGLIALARDVPAVVALLLLPTVPLFLVGIWTTFVRPPQWLQRRFPLQRGRTADRTGR